MSISFSDKAKGLTKNPLGIIALFVSLIYGIAGLVLSVSISNLSCLTERLPLIWFIIIFPIVIFIGFIFLVVKHHEKLYAPLEHPSESSFLLTFENKGKSSIREKIDQESKKQQDQLIEKLSDIITNNNITNSEMDNNNIKEIIEKTFSGLTIIDTTAHDSIIRDVVLNLLNNRKKGQTVYAQDIYMWSLKENLNPISVFEEIEKMNDENIIHTIGKINSDPNAVIKLVKK